MWGRKVFERFLNEAPICVMARATLENVLARDRLDALFGEVAQEQYQRELLFSTLVDLMSLVVCRVHPSVHDVYQQKKEQIPVSVKAVYDKLANVEPVTSRALVQHTAEQSRGLIRSMGGGCQPLLPGYQVKILDGNHLQGSDHRIQELREVGGGALPGLCLALLDPRWRTIEDVIPCEDAHTQECCLLDGLLEQVEPKDVWIDDRHYCTSDCLFGLISRGAFFITRQHAGHLRTEPVGPVVQHGRTPTGTLSEQKLRITHPQTGETLLIRRITVTLDRPTRDGETQIHLLTNLPVRDARAKLVAALYRQRWTLETAFQEMTVYLHCELNTLGYPRAALFGFCTAAACYNVFAVLLASLRSVHGEQKIATDVSLFRLTGELAGTYRGMMIALPPTEWTPFETMPCRELARQLKAWAKLVKLSRYRKQTSGQKRRTIRPSAPHQHQATARLLQARKPPP